MNRKYLKLSLVVLILVVALVYYSQKFNSMNNVNIRDESTIKKMVGQIVTFQGKAYNAKMGAIIIVEDEPIYIENLGFWPDDILEKNVVVKGKLSYKQYLSPINQNSIEKSAGANKTNSYVLEQTSWKLK